MKIVYLIGNGFDVNLDLKTSYQNFYEVYRETKSPNDLIYKLKECTKDTKQWADLELALGQYTSNLNSVDEFNQIYEDLQDNLALHLQKEEDKIDTFEIDKQKFLSYINTPEECLTATQKREVVQYKQKWYTNSWHISFMTFNYTKTIEKIINSKPPLRIGIHHNNTDIMFMGINHIHGYIEDGMVIGVNDISQISNKAFHNQQDVLDSLVKSECNKAKEDLIDEKCKEQILSSNLVCIFGSSLGDTDKLWWELIDEKLKEENFRLIIFKHKDIKIPRRRKHKEKQERDKVKDEFLSKTLLSDEEKEQVKSKIFVGLNTDLFKGIVKSKETLSNEKLIIAS